MKAAEQRLRDEIEKLSKTLQASEHERSRLLKNKAIVEHANKKGEEHQIKEETSKRILRRMNTKLKDEVESLTKENEELKMKITSGKNLNKGDNRSIFTQPPVKQEFGVIKKEPCEDPGPHRNERDNSEELQKTVEHLQAVLQTKDNEIGEMRKQIDENETTIMVLYRRIEKIGDESNLKEEFCQFMKKNVESKDMMEAIRSSINDRVKIIDALNGKIQEDDNMIEKLKEQNSEMMKTLGDLRKGFKAEKKEKDKLALKVLAKELRLRLTTEKKEKLEKRIQLLEDFGHEMKELVQNQARKSSDYSTNLEDMSVRMKLLDNFGERMRILVENQEAKKTIEPTKDNSADQTKTIKQRKF